MEKIPAWKKYYDNNKELISTRRKERRKLKPTIKKIETFTDEKITQFKLLKSQGKTSKYIEQETGINYYYQKLLSRVSSS